MPKVLITDGFHKDAFKIFEGSDLEIDLRTKTEREDFLNSLSGVEGLIVRSATTVDAEALSKADSLKVIIRAGEGVDNIDLDAATKNDVVVENTPGANGYAVVELTIGFLFALARKIPQATASTKHFKWEKSKFKGFEIAGKTLGIIGLGKIGAVVGEKALALGMNVIGFDPIIKTPPHPDMKLLGSIEEVMAQSDFSTVHVPKIPQTANLIGKDQFSKMKSGSYFLHVARGGIIDEMALLDALKDGTCAGAALDVFATEPPPIENPLYEELFKMDNVILTPHVGAQSLEAQYRVGEMAANQMIDFFKGKINFQVNP